jgi:hypothetical protein
MHERRSFVRMSPEKSPQETMNMEIKNEKWRLRWRTGYQIIFLLE